MNLYRPAVIEFDFDYLGDILTQYARHKEILDERFTIVVNNIIYNRKDEKFQADCEVYKETEH